MSITWHLRKNLDSPVGEFLQLRFSHTKRLTIEANRQLQPAMTCFPSTAYSSFKTLEHAIRYRIGYSFAHTPHIDLPAWRGAFRRLVWVNELRVLSPTVVDDPVSATFLPRG